MSGRAEGVRVAHPLFQAGGGGASPTSALQLRFYRCDVDTAVALNRLWHSRLPVVKKSNVTRTVRAQCYVAEFDGLYYAVAIWTNPVARLLPQETWLELRRFAVAPDAPKNAASRVLGWMTRDIRRRFPAVEVLVSYQDTTVHTGCIYRAVGWVPTRLTGGDDWDGRKRGRSKSQTNAPKQRWEKLLLPGQE